MDKVQKYNSFNTKTNSVYIAQYAVFEMRFKLWGTHIYSSFLQF